MRLTTLNALLAEHVATPKFRAWLLSLFGAVALCLAMAGVYGVMAFVAGQRSKEIAVRMALGAGARSVLWLMLSRGLKITAIGLTAGVLGAIASTRLVSGMLFQVQPHDVVTYAGVVGALGLLSLLATYLPARRARGLIPPRASSGVILLAAHDPLFPSDLSAMAASTLAVRLPVFVQAWSCTTLDHISPLLRRAEEPGEGSTPVICAQFSVSLAS